MNLTDTIEIPDWARSVDCAITVCDKDGIVLYQNDKSLDTFAKSGPMAGRSLIPCHSDRSRSIIAHMLATGDTNAYTITKNGRRKLVFQSPWRDADGAIAGLVEFSIVLPDDMPHYDRDAEAKTQQP